MNLALFDLDNTLLDGDSDYGWGEYMAEVGLVDGSAHRAQNLLFYEAYKAGKLVMADYLAFQLAPLKKYPRAELLHHRAEYIATMIKPMMRPQGLAAIKHHRKLGHEIIIITATNEFVTRPIADLFGVDTLIATEVEEIDGQWTGRGRGVPSFGAGKITRLEAWLQQHALTLAQCEAWFYSDSMNDLPLLTKVQHPVVISPDERLAAHAKLQSWPIEIWKRA